MKKWWWTFRWILQYWNTSEMWGGLDIAFWLVKNKIFTAVKLHHANTVKHRSCLSTKWAFLRKFIEEYLVCNKELNRWIKKKYQFSKETTHFLNDHREVRSLECSPNSEHWKVMDAESTYSASKIFSIFHGWTCFRPKYLLVLVVSSRNTLHLMFVQMYSLKARNFSSSGTSSSLSFGCGPKLPDQSHVRSLTYRVSCGFFQLENIWFTNPFNPKNTSFFTNEKTHVGLGPKSPFFHSYCTSPELPTSGSNFAW